MYCNHWFMNGFRKTVLAILITLSATAIYAQSSTQLTFNKANKLLQQGKIVQALDRYNQLVEQDKVSGPLFINTGYTYMQLGKLGKAKYYFLKAKSFDETRQKAKEGLHFIENQLTHQSVVLPTLPWERALSWLQLVLGATPILAIGLILLNGAVFILVYHWIRRKPRSITPKVSGVLATAGILIMFLSFYMNYRQQRYSGAVMVTPQANVLEKPAQKATLINKAYEGYSLTVDHKKSRGHEQWIFVEMSNGAHGWIRRDKIMIL